MAIVSEDFIVQYHIRLATADIRYDVLIIELVHETYTDAEGLRYCRVLSEREEGLHNEGRMLGNVCAK